MNDIRNIQLIESVERFPCIYNISIKDYSNRDVVQKAWETIAKELNNTVKECKESWRHLRIVFTRNLKLPPSGAGKKKKWIFMDNMLFLKPYVNVKPERLYSNLPSPSKRDQEEDEINSAVFLQPEEGEHLHTEENLSADVIVEEPQPCSSKAAIKRSTAQSFSTTPMDHPPIVTKRKKQLSATETDRVVFDYIKKKN